LVEGEVMRGGLGRGEGKGKRKVMYREPKEGR
jgi:hypothetical protein